MINRSLLVFGFALLCVVTAHAAEQPERIVVTLSCRDVRALVALSSWELIASRAREAGASERLIEAAQRCLQSSHR